jgi:hypothetical protein
MTSSTPVHHVGARPSSSFRGWSVRPPVLPSLACNSLSSTLEHLVLIFPTWTNGQPVANQFEIGFSPHLRELNLPFLYFLRLDPPRLSMPPTALECAAAAILLPLRLTFCRLIRTMGPARRRRAALYNLYRERQSACALSSTCPPFNPFIRA